MLKTAIFASLLASAAAPGGITYNTGSDAITHATEQIKAAHARGVQVCYDNKDSKQAKKILMHARLPDGADLAYEIRLASGTGYRVAQFSDPENWPYAVACLPI